MCTAQGQFQATIFTTMLWYISVFTCKTLNSSLVNPEGKALTQDLPLELPHVLQVNTSEGVVYLLHSDSSQLLYTVTITDKWTIVVFWYHQTHLLSTAQLMPDTPLLMLRVDFLK